MSRNFGTHGRKLGTSGWLIPLLVLLCIIGGLVFFIARQNSGSEIRVAQVCALSTQTSIPSMVVIVTLYDKDGHLIFSHDPYQVQGSQVELQGNVIANPVVTYRLTSLQGHFDDPRLANRFAQTPISLSRGVDTMYPLISKIPTVTPSSNSLLVQSDGHAYNIYVTATGLSASIANGPLACGLNHQAAG